VKLSIGMMSGLAQVFEEKCGMEDELGSADRNSAENIVEELKEVNLYGGAIRCLLPVLFMDTSTLRPVPDNQEVWLGPDFVQGCFIMDLLSFEKDASPHNPLEYFFDDLAHDNDVAEGRYWLARSSLQNLTDIPVDTTQPFSLHKFKQHSGNLVATTGDQNLASVHTGVGFQCVSSCDARAATLPPPFDELDQKAASWIRLEMCLIRLKFLDTDILLTLSKPLANNQDPLDEKKEDEQISPLFESISSSFVLENWSLFG